MGKGKGKDKKNKKKNADVAVQQEDRTLKGKAYEKELANLPFRYIQETF